MKRFDCLQLLAGHLAPEDIVVSSLGGTSLEWHALRDNELTMYGSALGCHLPMAMGLAAALPHRRILCLESDGSVLHCLGALATLANYQAQMANLRVFILDNGGYEQTGKQPSATHSGLVDLAAMARSIGIAQAVRVDTPEAWETAALEALRNTALTFVVARVEIGAAKVPGRAQDGRENMLRFVRAIERAEQLKILGGHRYVMH